MISSLYDRPGAWLVDHPKAKITFASLGAVIVFMLAGAPGAVGQYSGHTGGSNVIAM